jgi:hypothetical protein
LIVPRKIKGRFITGIRRYKGHPKILLSNIETPVTPPSINDWKAGNLLFPCLLPDTNNY